MRLHRILAMALSAILLLAMPLAAVAEAVEGAEPAAAQSIAVNGVDLSETASSTALSAEDVAAYSQIAKAVAASDEGSVTIEGENGASVNYTLGETTEDGATVLTAVEKGGDGAVSVSSVSEIVLTTTETPATETPATETPATETPATETPATETPATETPATETPATEEPAIEPGSELPELVVDEYGEGDGIYEGVYAPTTEAGALGTLTMDELLVGLGGNLSGDELSAYRATSEYQTYMDFATSVGLGSDVEEIVTQLRQVSEEYAANKAAYDAYLAAKAAYDAAVAAGDTAAVAPEAVAEPIVSQYTLEELTISMDKEVAVEGSGYITEITVSADAVYNIQYGSEVEVEVEVPFDGGTDFVITLDVSTSMDGTADKPMLQALREVMEEIMANEKNSVSIVFYGYTAGALTLDLDGDGVLESVFDASKYSAEDIFSAKLAGTGSSLNELLNASEPLDEIRTIYGTFGSTYGHEGLEVAYDLLSEIYGGAQTPADRNAGVMLFSDGNDARPGDLAVEERKLVEDFGATIVNVGLGATDYEAYMDPQNEDYIYSEDSWYSEIRSDYTEERELLMKENVVYYNIPETSNEELTERISEMFETAFKTITTTTQKLESGVIADGVLAAVEANLIDTVPATMEIVRVEGRTPSYTVLGKDENGNTLISWEIGNLYSGDELTFSYFMVPIDEEFDLKVDIATGVDTVLVTNPMDKVLGKDENTQIALIHCADLLPDGSSNATLPKTGDTSIPAIALVMGMILSAGGFVASKRYA